MAEVGKPAFIVIIKDATTDQAELDRYKAMVGGSFEGHEATFLAAYGGLPPEKCPS